LILKAAIQLPIAESCFKDLSDANYYVHAKKSGKILVVLECLYQRYCFQMDDYNFTEFFDRDVLRKRPYLNKQAGIVINLCTCWVCCRQPENINLTDSEEGAMPKGLKIAINTGGGDAPGLNAVIEAVVLAGHNRQWEVYGIRNGYTGLLNTDEIMRLTPEKVRHISSQGGTIIGTTNKGNPFQMPIKNMAGETEIRDVSDKVIENFKRLRFDCLIAVGGDGSLKIAHDFFKKGMPVVGVPKTIDNDLAATVITFGFDTAVSIATEALDRLHSTAKSHDRVMVIEVMGRHAGWIALNSGISGAASVILIPEVPFDMDKVCDHIMDMEIHGNRYAIVVAAEGAKPAGGSIIAKGNGELGRQDVILGGIGDYVAKEIAKKTGKDTRSMVLGHLQRGGSPTTFDRLLSLRFGAAAVRIIEEGKFGTMVALEPPVIKAVPLEDVIDKIKRVDLNSDTVQTARDIGICFGD
jgi:6-phosphofructokinase 1